MEGSLNVLAWDLVLDLIGLQFFLSFFFFLDLAVYLFEKQSGERKSNRRGRQTALPPAGSLLPNGHTAK